jgi:hypothetical protein
MFWAPVNFDSVPPIQIPTSQMIYEALMKSSSSRGPNLPINRNIVETNEDVIAAARLKKDGGERLG